MNDIEIRELYTKMLAADGIEARRWYLIEEIGEVVQAFSHEKRNRCDYGHVANELIDLRFVLDVVLFYYTPKHLLTKKTNIIREKMNIMYL